jgi:hypothetical protein
MRYFFSSGRSIQWAGLAAAALGSALLQAPAAQAIGVSTPGYDARAGIASFSGLTSNTSLTNNTYGYEFTTSVALAVQSLGVFDAGFNGLAENHQVGIWEQGNSAALASVLVPAGSSAALVNGFRYVDLPSTLALNAGTTYRIGALYLGAGDGFVECIVGCSSLTGHGITLGGSFYSAPPSTSLAYPNVPTSVSPGYFGPNFQVKVDVPGPLPLAGALSAFGFSRRLRRRIRSCRSQG